MWAIGNEPNAHSTDLLAYFRLTERLAAVRDEECPPIVNNHGPRPSSDRNWTCWHPITVPFADSTRKQIGGELLLSHDGRSGVVSLLEERFPSAVDVWSFQLYRGSTFGTFIKDYANFQTATKAKGKNFLYFFSLFWSPFYCFAFDYVCLPLSLVFHSVSEGLKEFKHTFRLFLVWLACCASLFCS